MPQNEDSETHLARGAIMQGLAGVDPARQIDHIQIVLRILSTPSFRHNRSSSEPGLKRGVKSTLPSALDHDTVGDEHLNFELIWDIR